MSLSKEELSAFLDGELAPQETARVAALVDKDPTLKSFVDGQDQLRSELRAAFSDVMTAPVPQRLLNAAATSPVSFRVRAREWIGAPGGSWSPALRVGAPVAAMALGILIGVGVERPSGTAEFGTSPNGQIVARADLADALEHKLASDRGAEQIGVTFHDKTGATCRTFTINAMSGATDGLACRSGGEWQVGALISGQKAQNSTDYSLAGSEMPEAIRGAIASRISGEPLDATAERSARDSGWK
jgi:hypothetical protein